MPAANGSMIAEGMIERASAVFTAMGHVTRLRLIDHLASVESATPNELADHFGESQQNISKHLRTLAQVGLVDRRREGSSAIYTIHDAATTQILDDVVALARRAVVEMSSHAGLEDEARDSGAGGAR